jgi:ABC-type phosphate transport system substrate-binding protein
MKRVRTFSVAVLLMAATLCQARDLAIVVNKSNATASVTGAELERLLKAGTSNWPDGKKVKVFLTDPSSTDNKTILQRVYKMAPAEIKTLLDAHKAEIQVVASDDLVLMMVSENPGAIGIVNVYSITSQVKVLKIDDKLPMEQGYLLHGN